MELAHEYTRKRSDFGRHPNFEDTEVSSIFDKDTTEEALYTNMNETITEVSCIPEISIHAVNTESFIQDDQGMHHEEGGWPKEVNTKEFSEKQRHIRKIKNDEIFGEQVSELAGRTKALVKQNNSIDMFETYFTDSYEDYTGEPPVGKTVTIVKDPHGETPRAVSNVCWHPDNPFKIAVSYCILQFQKMSKTIPLNSYIWDIRNSEGPDCTIKPQSPLVTTAFNPKSPEHLVGGCYSGQIGFWDLRKGETPITNTKIEHSHNDPVYDIYWIQSRTGLEFCSVSTDGYIHW